MVVIVRAAVDIDLVKITVLTNPNLLVIKGVRSDTNPDVIPPRKNILPISSLGTLSNTSKIKGKNGVTNPCPRPFKAPVDINL